MLKEVNAVRRFSLGLPRLWFTLPHGLRITSSIFLKRRNLVVTCVFMRAYFFLRVCLYVYHMRVRVCVFDFFLLIFLFLSFFFSVFSSTGISYFYPTHSFTHPPRSIDFSGGETNEDIAIVTAGAHLHDMGDMTWVFSQLGADFASRRKEGKKMPASIVWKTQSPGHVGCQDYPPIPLLWRKRVGTEGEGEGSQVTTDAASALASAAADSKGFVDKYHWAIFPKFDAFARTYAHSNEFGLNMTVLDVSPLYLRPDGHIEGTLKDCLHYCQPGPLNLFPQLLMQMLFNKEI